MCVSASVAIKPSKSKSLMRGCRPKLKNRDFMSEPMGDKLATSLPGIGEVLGERLREAGFRRAYHVLGKFLMLSKDADRFKAWLKDTFKANVDQAGQCYNCLRAWCDAHL
ncbi:barrier-to-autointegration factor-like [Haliotis rubra]|uniref:barrier-to-autointegration factor-like n=1 Tax=Haliotis rubra TaxID=36100 RepID=UPI001EE5730F|nr:barrier-to-autointegration factor-like [Haliotis rubra]